MAAQSMRPLFNCSSTKSGSVNTPPPAHRQAGEAPDLIRIAQETALAGKIRMICRRDRIGQPGVIGKGYMKAGHPGLLQQWNQNRQFLHKHTGVAVMRLLLAHGQLEINGHVRHAAAD